MDKMSASRQILALGPAEYSSYESIDLDRLVIYAVARLVEMNLELSLENIIVATFKLFPKKFSLIGYSEFPDATRVEKCLWRCRGKKRGWLGGKTPHGYILTAKGRIVADHAASLLTSPLAKKVKSASQTRRKESIISEVVSSQAFQKYVRGEGGKISEAEFCYVLQGTLDSLKDTLRENLDSLKVIADEVERKDIAEFLALLQNRFTAFLNAK
jgi:hypothetical protein